jgi:hypothetical protein
MSDILFETYISNKWTYAIFTIEDSYNSGALVQGEYYIPSVDGVLIYLNGGKT